MNQLPQQWLNVAYSRSVASDFVLRRRAFPDDERLTSMSRVGGGIPFDGRHRPCLETQNDSQPRAISKQEFEEGFSTTSRAVASGAVSLRSSTSGQQCDPENSRL